MLLFVVVTKNRSEYFILKLVLQQMALKNMYKMGTNFSTVVFLYTFSTLLSAEGDIGIGNIRNQPITIFNGHMNMLDGGLDQLLTDSNSLSITTTDMRGHICCSNSEKVRRH